MIYDEWQQSKWTADVDEEERTKALTGCCIDELYAGCRKTTWEGFTEEEIQKYFKANINAIINEVNWIKY